MPATKSLGEFEVLGFRRRGFSSTNTPTTGAVSVYGRNALAVDGSTSTGQIYAGYTPTIYAAPAAIGAMDGSSEANAMSLTSALAAANPGDVIGCIPGTYSAAPPLVRWSCCFQPARSGTLANPIRVVCKYDAQSNRSTPANISELRSSTPSPVASGSNSAVIGSPPGINHVHYRGFKVDQVYAPPRPSNGSVLVSYGCTGTRFERFWMVQTVNPASDNFDSFYLEGDTDSVIRNNYISGGTGAGNHNASAITTYGSTNFLIEHNEGVNLNQFLFIKGSHAGSTYNSGIIRYNKATDCSQSFLDAAVIATTGIDVYQNLGVRCWRGVVVDNSAAAAASYVDAHNNTFVDMTGPGWNAESGVTLTSTACTANIVAYMSGSTANCIQFDGTLTAALITLDNNLYYDGGGNATFYQNSVQSTGLSAWQTATSQEATSAQADPAFINAGADNYHRTSYADGRGCYITGSEEIGIEAA